MTSSARGRWRSSRPDFCRFAARRWVSPLCGRGGFRRPFAGPRSGSPEATLAATGQHLPESRGALATGRPTRLRACPAPFSATQVRPRRRPRPADRSRHLRRQPPRRWPGQVAFVRSPLAHARIASGRCRARPGPLPGVVAVYTAADLGVAPFHGFMVLNPACARPPLATGKVRFVGEAVAMVVAETRAAAVDAAELVDVDYEPLDAVADPKRARRRGRAAAVRGARHQPGRRQYGGRRIGPAGRGRHGGPRHPAEPADRRGADGGQRHRGRARRRRRRPRPDRLRVHPDAPRVRGLREPDPRARPGQPPGGGPPRRRRVRRQGRHRLRARRGHRGRPDARTPARLGGGPLGEPGGHARTAGDRCSGSRWASTPRGASPACAAGCSATPAPTPASAARWPSARPG